jgi:peptidoglycan/xylan/chitin deacetylase (PgdA/CDA1 family)
MTCVSITSCQASSQSSSATTVGEVVPVTNGIPGAPRPVPGTFGLDSVACASATLCEASGQTSPAEGQVVPIINGTPGAAQFVPGTDDLKSVACPSATACLAVGTGQGDSVGMITAFAAVPTIVSLTFDNGAISQYTLGYQQALSPHNVTATFYLNSGIIGGAKHISWSQLSTLTAAGEEIGGKTVDGTNLTTLTASQQIAEICNDRQALVSHGLKPAGFAYPAGAFNVTIESEVQNCGYSNARTAGSLSPAGPVYAETLPPKNLLALRAYAPTGRVTLSNLESLVAGAAARGGWVPIVIQKVCSQTADPNNYATCTASSGWIDLADLNAFLTWVQHAGQAGAAPFGTGFGAVGAIAAAYAGGSG